MSYLSELPPRVRKPALILSERIAKGGASYEDAVELADRLFFLSERPTRIILEQTLSAPRGGRSEEFVASISADLRARAARSHADAGKI